MTDDSPTPATASVIPALIGYLFAHCVALVAILMDLVIVVPIYIELFDEADVELPVITLQVVNGSHLASMYWFALIAAVIVLDTACMTILAMAFRSQRWLLSAYSHAVMVVALCLLLWITLVLSIPIRGMSEAGVRIETSAAGGVVDRGSIESTAGVRLTPVVAIATTQ